MADPYDLTLHYRDTAPKQDRYQFTRTGSELIVTDLSTELGLSGGTLAISISYRGKTWIYEFKSKQWPPQEPKLFIDSNNDLSIQGAGTLIPIPSP